MYVTSYKIENKMNCPIKRGVGKNSGYRYIIQRENIQHENHLVLNEYVTAFPVLKLDWIAKIQDSKGNSFL